jgi:uncharacterized damage-inducible protein DinB
MSSDTAPVLLQFLCQQLEQEAQTTSKVLAAVPADRGDYKPHDTYMSGIELARHIAVAEVMFLKGVLEGQCAPDATAVAGLNSGADVAAYYTTTVAGLIDQLKALPAEKAGAEIPFYKFQIPVPILLQLAIKHSVHHRGQLSAYLRPMGAKVPAIYGGSADEPMRAAEQSA